MSVRHKYAFNDVYFFENAREHMERNDFPRIPIGRIGGIHGWYLTIMQWPNEVYYRPFIQTRERKTMLKCRAYFNILKTNGSDVSRDWSSHLEPTFGPFGKGKTVDELLNEENGYLTNGGIMIEYGIQIEGILSDIWTFNFHDPLLDCQRKCNMITFHGISSYGQKKYFHCHKQLLTFHSTYFNSDSKENQMIDTNESVNYLDDFLQISHGVRDRKSRSEFNHALQYAQKYKLFNVIQLIDQFLVVLDSTWVPGMLLLLANIYGLKHNLANFLKTQKTAKELAEILDFELDLEKMSGEAMKKCVKRFFEF